MQQTLFQCWNRKAKYPKEIARLIHSFLPGIDELFCEQRFRFLKNGVLTSKDYERELLDFASVYLINVNKKYSFSFDIDIDKSLKNNKRFFKKTIHVYWGIDNPDYEDADGMEVNYSFQSAEVITEENISEILRKEYGDTIHTAIYQNQELLLLNPGSVDKLYYVHVLPEAARDIFVVKPKYKSYRTLRYDMKPVFFPTPRIEVLHRLL